jgi:hypothetical protein
MFENPTVNLRSLGIMSAKTELIFNFLYAESHIHSSSVEFVSCIQRSFVNFALRLTYKQKPDGVRKIQQLLSQWSLRIMYMST